MQLENGPLRDTGAKQPDNGRDFVKGKQVYPSLLSGMSAALSRMYKIAVSAVCLMASAPADR